MPAAVALPPPKRPRTRALALALAVSCLAHAALLALPAYESSRAAARRAGEGDGGALRAVLAAPPQAATPAPAIPVARVATAAPQPRSTATRPAPIAASAPALPAPVIPRGIEPSAAMQVLAPDEVAESPLAGVAAGFRYEGNAPVEPPAPPGDLVPVYPPGALAIGWQGSVVALVAVDSDGTVMSVHFERDDAWLNPPVEAMLRATRFVPATQAGAARAGYAVLRFDFRILGSPEDVAKLNAAAPFPLNP